MVTEFKSSIYDKYLCTLSRHITQRFPDINLIEGFEIFNPNGIPQELALQPSYGSDSLDTLISHCSPHHVAHAESTKEELKIFNSVIAANSTLKQLTTRQLMTHILKTEEMNTMFPNLAKLGSILGSIGLLLPMSTVDCECGFSALTHVKTDLRNRLSNNILNSLLTISIEGPPSSKFPYDDACNLWTGMRNRRIDVTKRTTLTFFICFRNFITSNSI